MRRASLCLLLFLSMSAHGAELRAPESASIDSVVKVELVGDVSPKSFVSIVAPDTAEGKYGDYEYARSAQVEARTPAEPGDYELRLLGPERPYPTLARRPIRVHLPQASLQAPERAPIGTEIEVRWRGPSGSNEYVTLVPAELPDGKYEHYVYARNGDEGSVTLTTPAMPGAYELRYMTGRKNVVIARRALAVGDVAASLRFADAATVGATLTIDWVGPGNERDFITIVSPDAAPRDYGDYAYTRESPVQVPVPTAAGPYEVRYLSADSSRILARGPLRVEDAGATLDAPAAVDAWAEFAVAWKGPGNELDYVAVTQIGKFKEYLTYSYARRGNPLSLRAPKQAGDYELHYVLGGAGERSLAMRPLTVRATAEPGSLRVFDTGANAAQGAASSAVELILDASGSMLQKLGARRRIEIAREALEHLVQNDLAPGSPVALRVFGHRQPDACDTELLSPLAPLDRTRMTATVRGIEAKNLARTPIGASLAAVARDVAAVQGPVAVILITDGEETCDGDPAAEIRRLRASGIDVVLNIVGFAIDEYALEQTFRDWAGLGGGAYLSATDAEALARSVRHAARRPFAVYRGDARIESGTVGGDEIALAPGDYEVHVGAQRIPLTIRAGERSEIDVGAAR